MAITISTGTTLQIGKTYGAALSITAISNANPAVATFADASTINLNDFIELSSGWGRLDKAVVRVSQKTGNNVTLEKVNTTDTSKYAAGAGIGSARRITAFDQLSQIKSLSSSGGEPKFSDISSMDDFVDKQVPVGRTATTQSIVTYDDVTLAWYATVEAATDSLTPAALVMTFPNGSKMAGNFYWSMGKTPDVVRDEALTGKIDLTSAATLLMRY
jgi:hypothetical protein